MHYKYDHAYPMIMTNNDVYIDLLIMGSHVGTDITKHEVLQVDSSFELCSTSTAAIEQYT